MAVAVLRAEAERRRDVGLFDDLAALGEPDEFFECACCGSDRRILSGHGDGPITQRNANRKLVFDTAQIDVVVPQQVDGIEMFDGELANVQ